MMMKYLFNLRNKMNYQVTVKNKQGKLHNLYYNGVTQKEVIALTNKAIKFRGFELINIQPIVYS